MTGIDVLLWDRATDWTGLGAASGRDGGGIPTAMDRLANAESTEQAEAAYWDLDNVVVLQGSVYEAAVPLIEPLIRLVIGGTSPARRYGVELILQIVGGWTDPTERARTGRDLVAEARDRLTPPRRCVLGASRIA